MSNPTGLQNGVFHTLQLIDDTSGDSTEVRQLFLQAGYRIQTIKGIPAPFPLAIGENWLSRCLLTINQMLIKLFPRVFAYQIILIASPSPTLDDLWDKNHT